ncbi:hypothetical protein, partial [Burkholderia anthina]|uniref:hypothetical protein n=1 Tax=Burkholderia anthina TaxID=179879 RepID=UPI001C89D2D3
SRTPPRHHHHASRACEWRTGLAEPLTLLTPLDQVMHWEDDGFDLGGIPNLHSLVPYSQEARKPIFDCGSADGLRGAHLAKATGSRELYQTMSDTLINLVDTHGL